MLFQYDIKSDMLKLTTLSIDAISLLGDRGLNDPSVRCCAMATLQKLPRKKLVYSNVSLSMVPFNFKMRMNEQ